MTELVKALNKHVSTANWNKDVAAKLEKMVEAVSGEECAGSTFAVFCISTVVFFSTVGSLRNFHALDFLVMSMYLIHIQVWCDAHAQRHRAPRFQLTTSLS